MLNVVDTLQQSGLSSLMLHCGTGILSQGRRAGPLRLGSLLGAQRLYPASAVGDMFTGASLAYGIATIGHSLDAWFTAKTIVLWGVNAAVTRIPDAHYLSEARYNGAKIYCITPEYNATAKLSTDWRRSVVSSVGGFRGHWLRRHSWVVDGDVERRNGQRGLHHHGHRRIAVVDCQ